MVLTHTTNHTYSHPFPTVTLAYFLRYCSPQINPFAAHVLSTDTISSHVDPKTGRLHTTRVHVKKSRIPAAVVKLLPASLTGGGGEKASYILETSVVDIKEGWLRSESRNLDHVSVLSVVEKQLYTVPKPDHEQPPQTGLSAATGSNTTDVATTLVFRSRVGERIRDRLGQGQGALPPHEGGWLARLGARGVQRSIESIASSRTQNQLGKSREGMLMVLERIRQTGVLGVLEMRRRAREQGLEIA